MTARGLVLAGGGVRVAWQTGVLAALEEEGLTFTHGDGTSGGIFTLAMLLSGQGTDEMVDRWHGLDPRAFMSLLPLRSYLRVPTDWAALGGAQGIRQRVLPALGVDLERVRAATHMSGSFNVADFGAKRCVPIPHTEIDLDRMVAGVSLAGLMPAVEHGGRTWTDAVWIQDANLYETARRGCDELWVLWCIGNTPRWGAGALEQYVHMIEMSATAALLGELALLADVNRRRAAGEPVLGSTTPITVHVVRPALPLPLDPELLAGRIDTETLIAMGYRDGRDYLRQASPTGVPLTEDPTRTPARPLGARVVVRATCSGPRDGALEGYRLTVEADDLALIEAGGRGRAVGMVTHRTHGRRMLSGGTASLSGTGAQRRLDIAADVTLDGRSHRFEVAVPLVTGRLRDARRHSWRLTHPDGSWESGTGGMSVAQVLRAVTSVEPTGVPDLQARLRSLRLLTRTVRGRAGVRPAAFGQQPGATSR